MLLKLLTAYQFMTISLNNKISQTQIEYESTQSMMNSSFEFKSYNTYLLYAQAHHTLYPKNTHSTRMMRRSHSDDEFIVDYLYRKMRVRFAFGILITR